MSNEKNLEMHYGALFKIEEQLNEQGFTLGENEETLEKAHFSINYLFIHRLLTDSEKNRCLDRLHKKVLKALKEV